MGSDSTTRVAALLLLLGAALATVPGRPTVMEVRNGWVARGQGVSVASANQAGAQDSYDYGEEKEVCLQEVNRRDCQTHTVEDCGGSGSSCDAVHSFWTSELTCCHDKHDYNYGHGSATVGDHLWGGGHGTIGTCDWTMHYVESPIGVSQTNILKFGAASAICYFGVDSQECGGPFCERMVMSLEGYVYGVQTVYTYWAETDTSPGEGGETCDVVSDERFGELRKDGSKVQQPTNNKKAVDNKAADGAKSAPVKPAAASSDASAQYYDGGHYDNRPVYQGTAAVINGIVTTMAGPRKEKWDSGVFEFVLEYTKATSAGVNPVTALDPNVPWVRDKAYKFTFYKQAHGC